MHYSPDDFELAAIFTHGKPYKCAKCATKEYNIDTSFRFSSRYADRAKKIKNNAVVNENPIDKLIRELKVIQKCIKI